MPYRGCLGLDPTLDTLGFVVNKVAEGRFPHITVLSVSTIYIFHTTVTDAKLCHQSRDASNVNNIRGGADKSLARPTSRCRRTEPIVSLERGVCSCAESQVFSCYRG